MFGETISEGHKGTLRDVEGHRLLTKVLTSLLPVPVRDEPLRMLCRSNEGGEGWWKASLHTSCCKAKRESAQRRTLTLAM